MELIKVFKKDGKQLVDAKELYIGIGLNKAHWKRWAKMNIEDIEFFIEGVDWVFQDGENNTRLYGEKSKHYIDDGKVEVHHYGEKSKMGRPSKNYVITLEFAEHLAMMARTKKSHDYRNYFLELERQAKEFLSSEDRLFIEMGRGKKIFKK